MSKMVTFSNELVATNIEVSSVTARGKGPMPLKKLATVRAISAGGFHCSVIHSSGRVFSWGDGNFGRLGIGIEDRGTVRVDKNKPEEVLALRFANSQSLDCGYSHSAAIGESGQIYCWGGAMQGKLGLGEIADEIEMYCPTHTLMKFPVSSRLRFRQISCGNSHTAAITIKGDLYVWGCGDSGRLGLGSNFSTRHTPQLVKVLKTAGVKAAEVSCGAAHTAVCSAIREISTGSGVSKIVRVSGGDVYVAGPAAALGKFSPHFRLVQQLHKTPVKTLSCGYSITGCVTFNGELYTWGSNKSGCIGHHVLTDFVAAPRLVPCLYTAPKNLALKRPCVQSSTYNKRSAETAVDGNREGKGERCCIHTQVDANAFWEVDLGTLCVIETITLWNREDAPLDDSLPPDHFTKRLFPCWIMVSATPFDHDLTDAHKQASAKRRFRKNKRRSLWHLPSNIVGRYVRVQLEKTNYLHFAQLEVYGTRGVHKSCGQVSRICCGKDAMAVLISPTTKESDIVQGYKRAVRADMANAEILRQHKMYSACWEKWKRGDEFLDESCPNCRGSIQCEICVFMKHGQQSSDQTKFLGSSETKANCRSSFRRCAGTP